MADNTQHHSVGVFDSPDCISWIKAGQQWFKMVNGLYLWSALKSWVWIKRGHVPASRCRFKCFICESGAAGSTIVIQTHKSHSTQTSRQQDKRQTSETQTINKAILCWDLPLSGHTSALKCCFDNIQSGRTAWFRGVAVREFNWGDT